MVLDHPLFHLHKGSELRVADQVPEVHHLDNFPKSLMVLVEGLQQSHSLVALRLDTLQIGLPSGLNLGTGGASVHVLEYLFPMGLRLGLSLSTEMVLSRIRVTK